MSEYKAGDLVEATKGERVVRDRIVQGGGPIFAGRAYLGEPSIWVPNTPESYESSGYSLEIIESAPVPLPTESGVYASTHTDIGNLRPYYLDGRGVWHELDSDGPIIVTREDVREFAPLTRLDVTK